MLFPDAIISVQMQIAAIEIAVLIITFYNLYLIWFGQPKNPDNEDNIAMTALWSVVAITVTCILFVIY